MLRATPIAGRDVAIAALTGWESQSAALINLPEYRVVGAQDYAWRLRHAELLPWAPPELLALAQRELATVDGELATHPDPARNLFQDTVQNEGWALYAEQEMWEQGGLGASAAAHVNTLRSWRFRIRRVVYDVNVETQAFRTPTCCAP